MVQETINRRRTRRPTLQSSNVGGGRNSGDISSSDHMVDGTSSSITSSSVSFALDPLRCPFSGAGTAISSYFHGDQKLQELGQAKIMARASSSESLRKLAQEHNAKHAVNGDGKNNNGGDGFAEYRRLSSDHGPKSVTLTIPETGTYGRRWSAPEVDVDCGQTGRGQALSHCPYSHGNSPQKTPKEEMKSDKKKNKKKKSFLSTDICQGYQYGLNSSMVQSIFPYHVVRICVECNKS